MKQNKEHTDLSAVDQQSKTFFTGGEFRWKKRKADVWENLEAQLEEKPGGRSAILRFSITQWAVAAGIALILGLGSFLRFYSIRIETPAGRHLLAELPDHSKVNLNAESTISYNPYWWKIKRIVRLEGEAFFEVEKGNQFTVNSSKGITQVLGTSFNIYSRDDIYKVTCITGTVKVKSRSGFEAILKPNSKAEIRTDGKINVMVNIEALSEISWKRNLFLFTATPVHEVFYEIERQYGVKIELKINSYSLYTGNFTRDQNVEEILNYVCPALGLKSIRKSAREYVIIQENE